MQYKAAITGVTCDAVFEHDEQRNAWTLAGRAEKPQSGKREKIICEELSVALCYEWRDEPFHKMLEEQWYLFHGTPEEIVRTIDGRYPMFKMDSDKLFDILAYQDQEKETWIAFMVEQVMETGTPVHRKPVHNALRESASLIISEMYGVERGKCHVLLLSPKVK